MHHIFLLICTCILLVKNYIIEVGPNDTSNRVLPNKTINLLCRTLNYYMKAHHDALEVRRKKQHKTEN